MGIPCDDVVVIQKEKKSGEPCVISINCPDKAGLGCDLCQIVLEFGLCIAKGDISTDGRWCYILLWVVQHPHSPRVYWESLKSRLSSACPSGLLSFYLNLQSMAPFPSPLYLLKFCSHDRKGLLHDVAKVLSHQVLTIQRLKVMTTPDGKVLDLFFITDGMDLLHTKTRRDDILQHLNHVAGEHFVSCELELAGPQFENEAGGFSSLSPEAAEELLGSHLSEESFLLPDMTKHEKVTITVDNITSPAHTLLQLQCVNQKNLLYDTMRASKDCDIKIAYGRFSSVTKGCRDIDLFVQRRDGKKIVDLDAQLTLCSYLKKELLYPLRVMIADRGPDAELLVANPVELSGKGRPCVFYDVICALRMLGICIFSAAIGRHSTPNCQWEVYRFLLDENGEFPLSSNGARSQIVNKVRRTLMGW